MSTVEISKEERDLWRFEASDECGTPSDEDERILRLLNALETTEALLDGSVQETRANFSAVYQACTEIIPDLKAKLADAVARAEKAEAEAARLTAERDWLAERCAELCDDDEHYGFLGHDESAKLWKRKAEEAALPGRGGGRRGEIMRHDEDLMYAEADGYVHFYCGSISYMEEGTLCGLGCDNPDVKDTDKTIVTCPQCIRILKVLRTVPFKERAVPVEG